MHKALRITPEGNIYGLFSIVNSQKIIFYSLINCVQGIVWEYKLSDVKMFLKYRYMFKHVAIEIWFFNKKRSFLLVFEEKSIRDNVFKFFTDNCEFATKYREMAYIKGR